MEITRDNQSVMVDIVRLNNYFIENGISDIEEWIPNATQNDRDGDIFLNRIYRVYNITHSYHPIPNFRIHPLILSK